jgi:hypothetical protein
VVFWLLNENSSLTPLPALEKSEMIPLFRDLWQREYFHLTNKEGHTKLKDAFESGGTAYVPKTNRVMNSVFIIPADLILLQWVRTIS